MVSTRTQPRTGLVVLDAVASTADQAGTGETETVPQRLPATKRENVRLPTNHLRDALPLIAEATSEGQILDNVMGAMTEAMN